MKKRETNGRKMDRKWDVWEAQLIMAAVLMRRLCLMEVHTLAASCSSKHQLSTIKSNKTQIKWDER